MPLLENYCIWDPLLCNLLTSLSWQDMGKINSQCDGGSVKDSSREEVRSGPGLQGGDPHGFAETRVWRALGAGGKNWQAGGRPRASAPCSLLLLTGVPLAFCVRIWMSSISSATQEELSLCDWSPGCQQATEVFQVDGLPAPLPLPAFAFLVKSWQDASSSHKSSVWPHPDGERGMFSIFIIIFLATHAIMLCKHPKISESKSLISYLGKSVVCNCSIGKVNGKWKARSRELIILCCRQN